ncbi:hypothetical protein BpHYR1_047397 [Brachionus plicatilis]|uniref:Uncharacterized protein n=1 Tax=Brachionus plicatilis TaxID=10195 RepID=A0A3M7T6D4_BRAPC|nr:hypothetical protein BpHYR1_047397 [Brachionus plicatilis]
MCTGHIGVIISCSSFIMIKGGGGGGEWGGGTESERPNETGGQKRILKLNGWRQRGHKQQDKPKKKARKN